MSEVFSNSSVSAGYEHFKSPSRRFAEAQKSLMRHPVEAESSMVSPLVHEVKGIRDAGEEDLYLLRDTGFQVKSQVDLLISNHKTGVPLSESLLQLEQDIQGFKTEYIVELPVFPILLEKSQYEGREHIVGSFYAGKPLGDATSADEREGVVKESALKIEEMLLNASPGDVIVWTSPDGWSGYQKKDDRLEPLNSHDVNYGHAQEIEYPDSQTYVYEVKENGVIRSFTIKTHMTLSQNQQLLVDLGELEDTFKDKVDQKTDIKRTVGSVVLIDSKNKESVESIVDKIQQKMGDTEVAYPDTTGKARTFTEIRSILKDPEFLWKLDATIREYVDPLKDYVTEIFANYNEKDSRTDLETALGLTVLKITNEFRPPKERHVDLKPGEVHRTNEVRTEFDPRATLTELKKVGGCAGGGDNGSKIKTLVESLSPRLGVGVTIDSIAPKLADVVNSEQEWFKCPKCEYQATGPIGDGPCPNKKCGLTQEQAREEGYMTCD